MDELLESPGARADPTQIGGFRTMRSLGVGDRARVLLAASDSGAPVALKRYRHSVPDAAIIREAAILDLVNDPHAVPLLDIGSDRDGRPVLVLKEFRGGALAELVARRTRLAPGECVTALAPIAELIGRLHDRGIAHGDIAAKHIVFSAEGVPVLAGWGSAVSRRSMEFERVRDEDRAALLTMARGLLPERSFNRSERMPSPTELVDLLHAAAAAAPIDLRAVTPDADQPSLHPGRFEPREPIRPPGSVARAQVESESDAASFATPKLGETPGAVTSAAYDPSVDAPPARGPAPGLLFALAEWPDRVVQLLQRGEQQRGGIVSGVVRRITDRLRAQNAGLSRRQRMLGMAGLAALLVSAVLLAQPLDAPATDAATGASPTGAGSVGVAETPSVGDVASQGGELLAAIEGADPEPAIRALLALREQCLLEVSMSCLASVLQTGSSAERDAIELLVSGTGAPAPLVPMPDDYQLIAVDRLGDSVLYRIETAETTPASVLMIRTEAGWRIRMLAAA